MGRIFRHRLFSPAGRRGARLPRLCCNVGRPWLFITCGWPRCSSIRRTDGRRGAPFPVRSATRGGPGTADGRGATRSRKCADAQDCVYFPGGRIWSIGHGIPRGREYRRVPSRSVVKIAYLGRRRRTTGAQWYPTVRVTRKDIIGAISTRAVSSFDRSNMRKRSVDCIKFGNLKLKSWTFLGHYLPPVLLAITSRSLGLAEGMLLLGVPTIGFRSIPD